MTSFPSELQAILFDKDGTLIDMDSTWGRAMSMAVVEVAADDEHRRWLGELLGLDLETMCFRPDSVTPARTTTQTGEVISLATDPNVFYKSVRKHASQMITETKGASDLLQSVGNSKLKIGMATNDNEAAAKSMVAKMSWDPYFDEVVGFDSGFGHKPDAGMLIGLLERLGVAAENSIMVGDTLADLTASKLAGIFYVQLGDLTINRGEFVPDMQIEELGELKLLIDNK